MTCRFNPSEAHKLEDPERLQWLPPDEVLAQLGLTKEMKVADIGAGTGYFAIPIARAVPEGHVMAVDAQPEMVSYLETKLRNDPAAPRNIELLQGDATHTGLHTHSYDLVLLANVWHELEDQAGALREAARILHPDGRLAILDWRADVDRPPGPPLEHRVAVEQLAHTLAAHGWKIQSSTNIGRYSYLTIVAVPKTA